MKRPTTTPRARARLQGPFGHDRFGRLAERFARSFGTARFIVGQTVLVAVWIALNAAAVGFSWDPYPFILLNLAFSTQAAYAAPLILLAQTRQADRDKARSEAADAHHDHSAALHERLLAENTRLTREVERLTARIYAVMTDQDRQASKVQVDEGAADETHTVVPAALPARRREAG